MDSDLARPGETPDTPSTSHRDHRRTKMTDTFEFGHGYAAVIERAAELHYSLGMKRASDGRTSEAELVSVTHAETRHRAALTLAGLREAAELILRAAPFNKKDPAVRDLVSLHIWRMTRAIEKDDHPTTTDQQP